MSESRSAADGREATVAATSAGHDSLALDSSWGAAGWYLVVTVLFTWPLLPGLFSDLPSDLGDSLLNCWILGWDADHFLRFLGGNLHALQGFWNGNLFYPSPLVLTYSEHMVVQALQILPIYALTHNLILCYNLLFLSTFVLSGLGVYLLVRDLTGNARAAFVAGLLFAFMPYRVAQFPHVQVLSTQWMAFTLYGLHRYFETKRLRPLAWAAVAWIAQNLSCGYFLLFFSPFAAAYIAWETHRRRLWGDWRVLTALATSVVVVLLVTLPFLLPYLELRDLKMGERTIGEVEMYSANALAYFTTTGAIRGWGRFFHVFKAPEGELYPGAILAGLALIGALYAARDAWRASIADRAATPAWQRILTVVFGVLSVMLVSIIAYVILGGGRVIEFGSVVLRLRNFNRVVALAGAALVGLIVFTPTARRWFSGFLQGPGFWLVAALAAAWLSMGPNVRTGLKDLGAGPYLLFYKFVPGFDGLRVPARLGLVAALMLAVLAGLAADRLSRARRRGGLIMAGLVLAFATEVFPTPIDLNGVDRLPDLNSPAPRVLTGSRVPRVYRYIAGLPAGMPVIEFPFGVGSYEVHYVYYASQHWHPIVNGYSGVFPPHYRTLCKSLAPRAGLDDAWEALASSKAQIAIVHEGAYRNGAGERLGQWLVDHGAQRMASFVGDKVYRLPW